RRGHERAPHPSMLTVMATQAMSVSPTGTRSPPATACTVTSPCGSSRFTASTSTAFGSGTPTVTSTSMRPPRARTSAKNGRLEWRIASDSARIEALWQLYLSYGVLVGVGMSSIYVLTAATVARWFEARRGIALAIVLSDFNLGWLTGGPLAAWLIGRWGWRTAYVTLGLLVAAVG